MATSPPVDLHHRQAGHVRAQQRRLDTGFQRRRSAGAGAAGGCGHEKPPIDELWSILMVNNH